MRHRQFRYRSTQVELVEKGGKRQKIDFVAAIPFAVFDMIPGVDESEKLATALSWLAEQIGDVEIVQSVNPEVRRGADHGVSLAPPSVILLFGKWISTDLGRIYDISGNTGSFSFDEGPDPEGTAAKIANWFGLCRIDPTQVHNQAWGSVLQRRLGRDTEDSTPFPDPTRRWGLAAH